MFIQKLIGYGWPFFRREVQYKCLFLEQVVVSTEYLMQWLQLLSLRGGMRFRWSKAANYNSRRFRWFITSPFLPLSRLGPIEREDNRERNMKRTYTYRFRGGEYQVEIQSLSDTLINYYYYYSHLHQRLYRLIIVQCKLLPLPNRGRRLRVFSLRIFHPFVILWQEANIYISIIVKWTWRFCGCFCRSLLLLLLLRVAFKHRASIRIGWRTPSFYYYYYYYYYLTLILCISLRELFWWMNYIIL